MRCLVLSLLLLLLFEGSVCFVKVSLPCCVCVCVHLQMAFSGENRDGEPSSSPNMGEGLTVKGPSVIMGGGGEEAVSIFPSLFLFRCFLCAFHR